MKKTPVWIIGTGYMAIEYYKVLKDLSFECIVIGRRKENCDLFFQKSGYQPIAGGLELFLQTQNEIPDAVINATSIESLTETTQQLLNFGVKYILLEKPGFGNIEELEQTVILGNKKNATILLAYNRRFYQSTLKANEIIKSDGGVKSFHFEFSEWANVVSKLDKHKKELENWFYGNSTHLIDLAFFLGGYPKRLHCISKGSLSWHSFGSIYTGCGETKDEALFSYIANWESPGRWNLELCTENFRLIFKPLEQLQVMRIGSIVVELFNEIDYSIDEKYKPGLFLQTKSFLNYDIDSFVNLKQQLLYCNNIYNKMR